MAKFEENNLREEEKSGRFEPGTPDDETLKLEQMDAYPGELPDFEGLENEDSALENQLDIDSGNEDDLVENTEENSEQQQKDLTVEEDTNSDVKDESTIVEDNDVKPELTEDTTENNIEEQKAQEPQEKNESDEVEPEIENTNDNQEEITDSGKAEDNADKNSVWELFDENENAENIDAKNDSEEPAEDIEGADDSELSIDDLEIPEEEVAENGENAIALDDDIIDVMEDDLAKSKALREKENVEDTPKEENIEFHPIDEEENVKEIDLTALDISEHPSNFNEESEPKQKLKKNVEPKKQSKKVKKEKTIKPKNKKNKKKIITYAAAFVATLLFATLLYDWGINRNGFSDVFGIGGKLDDTTRIAAKHNIHKAEKKEHKHQIKKEMKQIEPEETLKSGNEPVKDTIEVAQNEMPKNLEPKVVQRVKRPVLVKKRIIGKNKNIVKKATAIDKEDRSEMITPEFSKINFMDSETKHLKKSYNSNKEAVFVVQIYASPSKADAQDWLNDLISKGISDARITKQILRGKTWYRVRFGKFKSEAEARKTASKLGFARSWIDRIR